jgi:hypothetical protein
MRVGVAYGRCCDGLAARGARTPTKRLPNGMISEPNQAQRHLAGGAAKSLQHAHLARLSGLIEHRECASSHTLTRRQVILPQAVYAAETEGRVVTWTSDSKWLLMYSVLFIIFILAWACIPA